mmetsp:Transcript_15734/g.26259  ORF Transcript_15734/g.26259 Transcript_15734/m.26259 type:complete len:361 (+) Transcript_15734:119-1201(+)
MGNTLNVSSCVECMEDNSFPRPQNGGGGMCDSNSMQALPSNSVTGNQIPITTETVKDVVELSVSKPLGVTLCDSSMVKGVFVTVIKSEGNIAKLSQKVSVGMKLLELNGVDVSSDSLDAVIKKISDSPPEKRLILKFQGTAPAEETVSSVTTLNTTPPAASTTTSDSAPETKKEETTEQSDDAVEKDASVNKQEEEKKEEAKTEDTPQQEDEKDQKSTPESEEDKGSVEDDAGVTTPGEREEFGDFASGSMDTGQSLETVEIFSPAPVTPLADNLRDSKSSKDLDEEFANVSLHDETSPHIDTKVDEVTAPTVSSSSGSVEGGDEYDCSQCEKKLPKDSFTANQLKKKAKRKCKACCANK